MDLNIFFARIRAVSSRGTTNLLTLLRSGLRLEELHRAFICLLALKNYIAAQSYLSSTPVILPL